jgi:hypothetical protein
MPPADDIQKSLYGAWRMMTGKPDGVRMLDLSADGFWNSFFAIVVALPAFIVGWVAIANDLAGLPEYGENRLSLVIRLAIVDLSSWLLPLAALALVAPRVGIGGRFVHYVVASNWGSAIIVWMMLAPSLVRLFFPDVQELAAAVSLTLFLISLLLSWRLTNAALAKGPAVATAVFVSMAVASLVVLFLLQDVLGLTPRA